MLTFTMSPPLIVLTGGIIGTIIAIAFAIKTKNDPFPFGFIGVVATIALTVILSIKGNIDEKNAKDKQYQIKRAKAQQVEIKEKQTYIQKQVESMPKVWKNFIAYLDTNNPIDVKRTLINEFIKQDLEPLTPAQHYVLKEIMNKKIIADCRKSLQHIWDKEQKLLNQCLEFKDAFIENALKFVEVDINEIMKMETN